VGRLQSARAIRRRISRRSFRKCHRRSEPVSGRLRIVVVCSRRQRGVEFLHQIVKQLHCCKATSLRCVVNPLFVYWQQLWATSVDNAQRQRARKPGTCGCPAPESAEYASVGHCMGGLTSRSSASSRARMVATAGHIACRTWSAVLDFLVHDVR
jgi:hypothetical protein